MTRGAAAIGSRARSAIELALEPLADLTAIHPDEDVDAAVADVARRARTASEADQVLIRARAIDLLRIPRNEWTLHQRAERVDVHLSRTGARRVDEWPDPIPLDDYVDLPTIPLQALPAWLREWVAAEANATQTPPDMAAMLALAVVAAACQRAMRVRVRDDWTEPLNIYTASVLGPGNRKSAVMGDVREPLDAYECEQAQQLAPEIARGKDALVAAKKRHDRTLDLASKKHGSDRLAAEADVREAREELTAAESGLIHAPQLSCCDITQEELARLMASHGECMALLDAEGCGPFDIMAGRYTDGSAAIDLYLRAHAGDAYRCNRVGREPVVLQHPALTIGVTAQPDVLRKLGERREMRGLGLLARFLWCVPRSTVGRRNSEPPPMAAHVRATYASNVRALLALKRREDGEPHTVRLAAAAWIELRALMERLEPRLGPGGDLEHIADWAGKLHGAVVRIAGLLHAAEHLDCPWSVEMSADTMRRAIQIGDCLLEHARAALGEMGADPAGADARYVLAWMVAHDVRTISRRDLHRELRGRFKKAADLQPAIDLLAEREWIRVQSTEGERGPGRRPSPIIELTPHAHFDGRNGHNGRNAFGRQSCGQTVQSVPEGPIEEVAL